MPADIPPDLLRGFQQEVTHRWPDYLAGRPLRFGGLNIRKEKDGRIIAGCCSKSYFPENITEKEARDRIDVAKEEISALTDAFPELKAEIDLAGVDYEFCYDYGTAAVLVAEERGGVFRSTKGPANQAREATATAGMSAAAQPPRQP
jgi:hypothetical protein